jgi:hypothetical protein
MSEHNLVIFSSTFVCERVQKKRKHFGTKIKEAEHKKRTHPKTVARHLFGFQISFGGNDYRAIASNWPQEVAEPLPSRAFAAAAHSHTCKCKPRSRREPTSSAA